MARETCTWLPLLLLLLQLSNAFYRTSHHRTQLQFHNSNGVMMSNSNSRRTATKEDFQQETTRSGSKPFVFEMERDVYGLINFCLRPSDGALSGPSRTKVLNEITNDVFRALMIGSEQGVRETLSSFEKVRERLEAADCLPLTGGIDGNSVTRGVTMKEKGGVVVALENDPDSCLMDDDTTKIADALTSRIYLDWLQALLTTGKTNDFTIGGIYDRGYKRLLTTLKDAGCKFSISSSSSTSTSSASSTSTTTTVDAGDAQQQQQQQQVVNLIGRPQPISTNICLSLIDQSIPASRRTRTKVLNDIANCVSRAMLYGGKKERNSLAASIEADVQDFANEWCGGDILSQESLFMQALALLLKEGLAAAEEQISQVSVSTSDGAKGSMLRGTISSAKIITPRLRLFDTYYNAFQRVVDVCLTEIGLRAGNVNMNEDVLLNFVQWEQSLRRNLTANMWTQNPDELRGTWELIDIAGQGSLSPLMSTETDVYFGMTRGLMVELLADGRVGVKLESIVGLNWKFKPGPAHLDTCEFFIRSDADADLILKYVGFIDRGQRIESRFSKRPIRMTGRVVSMIRGEVRGSSRFVMAMRQKGGK